MYAHVSSSSTLFGETSHEIVMAKMTQAAGVEGNGMMLTKDEMASTPSPQETDDASPI